MFLCDAHKLMDNREAYEAAQNLFFKKTLLSLRMEINFSAEFWAANLFTKGKFMGSYYGAYTI